MTAVLIGMGNPDRGDDGAGIAVAKRVGGPRVHVCPGGSYELIDLWEGDDDVVIVDAAHSGRPPGTVHRFDGCREPISSGTFVSSHSVGVAEVVEMARALRRLPRRLRVYGIEVADVTLGAGLSPPVVAAVERTVKELSDA